MNGQVTDTHWAKAAAGTLVTKTSYSRKRYLVCSWHGFTFGSRTTLRHRCYNQFICPQTIGYMMFVVKLSISLMFMYLPSMSRSVLARLSYTWSIAPSCSRLITVNCLFADVSAFSAGTVTDNSDASVVFWFLLPRCRKSSLSQWFLWEKKMRLYTVSTTKHTGIIAVCLISVWLQ